MRFLISSKFFSARVAIFGKILVPDTNVAKNIANMYWLLVIDLSAMYFKTTLRALDVEIYVSAISLGVRWRP